MSLNYCIRETQLRLKKYSIHSKDRENSPFAVDKPSKVSKNTPTHPVFLQSALSSAPSLREFKQTCILCCILYGTSANLVIQIHLLHTALKKNRMRLGKLILPDRSRAVLLTCQLERVLNLAGPSAQRNLLLS